MPTPAITLIAGPTASGKSRRAMDLARRTGAVIVNADSQQLYADLRVLTARPSVAEEAEVAHRLYGVADAADSWSVGRWSRAVLETLAEIADAGTPAIVVGGTGLYFTALTRGLADIPPVPAGVRDETGARFDAVGEAAFRAELAGLDPTAAAAIETGDRQRLIRALSVARHTGRSLTDWRADTRPLLTAGNWDAFVVEPDREALYANCNVRVDAMIADGALDEVRALLARGLSPDLPALKAVGLRELAGAVTGATSLDEAVTATRQATRNYAKRQLTWFRNQTPEWPRLP